MIEQLADRPRNRVGHIRSDTIGIEADFLCHRLAFGFLGIVGFGDHPARDSYRRRPWRHLTGHHGIRTNLGAGAYGKRPKNLRAGADDNPILQGWMAFTLVPAGATQGHAVIKRHVIADLGRFSDNDAHAVIDEKTPTDSRTRMNLDAREPARQVGIQSRQPFAVLAPQPMGHPMKPDRVQARVAGDHLKGISRRGIAMEHALDIFAHTLEHQSCLRFLWGSPRTAFWVSVRMPRRMFISSLLMPLRP